MRPNVYLKYFFFAHVLRDTALSLAFDIKKWHEEGGCAREREWKIELMRIPSWNHSQTKKICIEYKEKNDNNIIFLNELESEWLTAMRFETMFISRIELCMPRSCQQYVDYWTKNCNSHGRSDLHADARGYFIWNSKK